MVAESSGSTAFGAYGIAVDGLAETTYLRAIGGDPTWRVRVEQRRDPDGVDGPWGIHPDWAAFRFTSDIAATVDRERSLAVAWTKKRWSHALLVHPFLSIPAVAVAAWTGREAFHGACFAGPSGAWGILGRKRAGKSSLAAGLALGGLDVVADDLIALDHERHVLAGPRCVDMRPTTATRLSVAPERTAPVRGRRRLPLPDVQDRYPLRGFVSLRWTTAQRGVPRRVTLTSVPPRERIGRLSANATIQVTDPASLLDLASLPMWELSRPRGWESFEESIDALRRIAEAPG